MEDEMYIDDQYLNDKNLGLFMILDGHAGYEVSRLAKIKIPVLLGCIYYYCRNFKLSIEEAFIQFNEVLHNSEIKEIGSTITLCVVERYDRFSQVTIANCGDSSAIWISKDLKNTKKITEDHNSKNLEEIQRIMYSGGELINNKVHGQVCVTRAIGDLDYTEYGMSSIPSIFEYLFGFGDIVVIASDGIWDVMSEDDVRKYVEHYYENIRQETDKNKDDEELADAEGDADGYGDEADGKCVEHNFNIAKLLTDESKKLGSNDNICCMVLTI
eukprot:Mrub_07401.p1 GENE.Mrub_07401~~Mrub_07401.p1  ORF type:complete len:298 (-),score=83.61 Mrub_07401:29-841(-)